jgi:ParB-like chromosome segregation protein Spo0J
MAKTTEKPKVDIQLIPLHLIDADHTWNCRSGDFRSDEEYGYLVESIGAKGQDTAILLRPHPDKSKAKRTPYAVVVGFRRFEALCDVLRKQNESFKEKDLATIAKALGAQMMTAKAEVKEMTEADARAANIRENMQRENVKPADTAFAVQELLKHGKNDTEIAWSIGKGQTYASKMHRICTLPSDVLKNWRSNPLPLTAEEMDQLSRVEGAAAQREAYEKAVRNKQPRTSAGKKSVMAQLMGQATSFASKLGELARADLIEITDDWEALIEHMIRIPDKMADKIKASDLRTIAAEAKRTYDEAKNPEPAQTDGTGKGAGSPKGKGGKKGKRESVAPDAN